MPGSVYRLQYFCAATLKIWCLRDAVSFRLTNMRGPCGCHRNQFACRNESLRFERLLAEISTFFTASYKPWEQWGFMGLLSYKHLLGDAEDSPVVDDEGDANQFSGGILVFYKF